MRLFTYSLGLRLNYLNLENQAPCFYVTTRSFKQVHGFTLTKIEELIEVEDDRDNEFVEVEKVQ
jgi:hypothetical protein